MSLKRIHSSQGTSPKENVINQTTLQDISPFTTGDIPSKSTFTSSEKLLQKSVRLNTLDEEKKHTFEEKKVGKYTSSEREEIIRKFLEKRKKRKEKNPTIRKFEGRRRAALGKNRIKGQFASQKNYERHLSTEKIRKEIKVKNELNLEEKMNQENNFPSINNQQQYNPFYISQQEQQQNYPFYFSQQEQQKNNPHYFSQQNPLFYSKNNSLFNTIPRLLTGQNSYQCNFNYNLPLHNNFVPNNYQNFNYNPQFINQSLYHPIYQESGQNNREQQNQKTEEISSNNINNRNSNTIFLNNQYNNLYYFDNFAASHFNQNPILFTENKNFDSEDNNVKKENKKE